VTVEVVRVGQYVEIQFTGAEIIETWGKRDELYGDGVITLTLNEAIRLAKELLEAVLEEEATAAEPGVPGVRVVRADGNRVALDVCCDAEIDPECEAEYVTLRLVPREAAALALALMQAAATVIEREHAGGQ